MMQFKAVPLIRSIILFLFFASFLFYGLSISEDFGISYDEPFQLEYGKSVIQYVNQYFEITDDVYSNEPLLTRPNRFHGPVFTATAAFLELYIAPESFRDAYLLRHKLTFILFWITTIFIYFTGTTIGGDWKWGLLASLLLILSPRIFGHAFYNPKDIPNLAFYTWAGVCLFYYLRTPSWRLLLLLSISSALALAMRMTGVFLPLLTIPFMFWLYKTEAYNLRTYILQSTSYLLLTFIFMVIFWPTLWEAPIARFLEAFQNMSAFEWEGRMLTAGKHVLSTALPVWYLPVWLAVTIPLVYLFLIISAFYVICKNFITAARTQKIWKTSSKQIAVYALAALGFGPFIVIVIKNPVIYNGWRHVYFIYPFLLLCGLWFLRNLWEQKKVYAQGLLFVLIINMVSIAFWIKNHHPYQYAYFNFLAGPQQFQQFDIDYWGLSYYQGFQKLAELDQRSKIKIKTAGFPGYMNLKFQPEAIRDQFVFLENDDTTQADYYLTHYWYWHDWRPAYNQKEGVFSDSLILELKSDNNPLLGIYKLTE